jgi:hypothetical protein
MNRWYENSFVAQEAANKKMKGAMSMKGFIIFTD